MAERKKAARDIGIDVKPPKGACENKNCPFHGTLPVRGRILQGTVVSDKAQGTVIVEMNYLHYRTKFERYERRHSRIAAHKPECIEAKAGSTVKIAECRPLSKAKKFVVVEVVK